MGSGYFTMEIKFTCLHIYFVIKKLTLKLFYSTQLTFQYFISKFIS